jgi:hypothetical protein
MPGENLQKYSFFTKTARFASKTCKSAVFLGRWEQNPINHRKSLYFCRNSQKIGLRAWKTCTIAGFLPSVAPGVPRFDAEPAPSKPLRDQRPDF